MFGHRAAGLDDHRTFEAPEGRSDDIREYEMLLRLDFDTAADLSWGTNALYVVIHRDDLAAGQLDRAVVTVASYLLGSPHTRARLEGARARIGSLAGHGAHCQRFFVSSTDTHVHVVGRRRIEAAAPHEQESTTCSRRATIAQTPQSSGASSRWSRSNRPTLPAEEDEVVVGTCANWALSSRSACAGRASIRIGLATLPGGRAHLRRLRGAVRWLLGAFRHEASSPVVAIRRRSGRPLCT